MANFVLTDTLNMVEVSAKTNKDKIAQAMFAKNLTYLFKQNTVRFSIKMSITYL